jgi:integration host factor subunit alpha
MPNNLTRADLAEAICERLGGLTRPEGQRLVNQMVEVIAEALASGESVQLSGFGRFLLHEKRERVGRNPMTLVEANISARRVMKFKPSLMLIAAINGKLVSRPKRIEATPDTRAPKG